MNFLGALLSFFMGLYGVAYVGAAIVAPDAGVRFAQTAPQQGGTMPPSGDFGGGGSFGGSSGGMMGSPPGGTPGMMPGGDYGSFGGQQGGQGMMGGQQGQGNQQWQGGEGRQGGQQGGQGMMGGQQGQGNQQWQGGEGQEGQGGEGNDEERMKQDEERQKKQEEEGNKRCLKDMQRGMQGAARPIKDLEKKVAQVKRAKATVPPAVEETVAKLKAGIEQIKTAKTCDEAQEIQQGISDSMENMQDLFMQLEFAAQAPKIVKQIKQGFGMMDKMWKRALANAKKSKVDLSEQVAKGQAIYDELKAMFDQMIAAVNSGDFEQMQGMMEAGDGAEEKRQEMEEVIQTIDAVRNTGQMLKGLNQHLAGLKRGVAQLKRQKKDVTEINSCLNDAKLGVDTVKAAVAAKPVDLEALVEAFEGANDVLGACDDLIGTASGQEEEGLFDDFFGGDMQKQIQSRPRQQQGGGENETCNVNGIEVPGSCSRNESGSGFGF
ncbi:hypothetical protein A3H75_00800 [Candidatus Uhrbacteria bacterium RIFCSPLOWO2_02_FULL_51_9]|uniref:Uncharacterized protein n=1 Tax=Candidatus Uhrbacteria bacterium RIFCSPLOWO2_02_FULL_51_9 TaxID=1802410 RepID=A0A1F7VF75_9BACT|nr:MAG: hypothetical protein A3H75_00800 [Candidatus Uhrbacteria bacterium RIFCSPLOWO2_02_FULL_51_9]